MGYTKTNEAVFSNELLDTVIEHSFDGIYITDGLANTLKVNRSYLTISGLKVSEVLGVNMRELVKNGTISASGTLMAMEQKRRSRSSRNLRPENGRLSQAVQSLTIRMRSFW